MGIAEVSTNDGLFLLECEADFQAYANSFSSLTPEFLVSPESSELTASLIAVNEPEISQDVAEPSPSSTAV